MEFHVHRILRCAAGLLPAWLLVATAGLADLGNDAAPPLEFNRPILVDLVFDQPLQQRQLRAARKEIRDQKYTAAFEYFRELLQEPYDSTLPIEPTGPVRGVRSAVLGEIMGLPASARRGWNQFCERPARDALRKALAARSRTALVRVAAEFPCSAAGADALITEAVWAISAHEPSSARLVLNQLQQWSSLEVLSRSQRQTIRRLEAVVSHAAPRPDADLRYDEASIRPQRLDPAPAWTWQESIWAHPDWPDVLPPSQSGDWHNDPTRWQLPLVTGESVVVRTPAGIACLDQSSGTEHWFLPLRSGSRARLNDMADAGSIFDITPAPDQRLETADGVIYFIDGHPVAPVQSKDVFRSRIVIEQGGTHLVAVRCEPRPTVLWQVSGYNRPARTSPASTLTDPPVTDYAFRLSSDAAPAPAPGNGDGRLDGHLFLSSPRVHVDRLYVTSHYDGATWLNCLSAAHGALIWQQPLTWFDAGRVEESRGAATVAAISDDSVVCLLAGGLIAGCSSFDGHLLWLQSVLVENEDEPEPDDFHVETQSDSRVVPQSGAGGSFGEIWLRRSPHGIVCGRRGSQVVCSLDPSSGELQWSVSRRVQGGTADQQPDFACLGLAGNHLIMMGYGHCRAIDAATGEQVWVRPLGAHSGRLCCNASRITAALNNGQLLTIDAVSGEVRQSQSLPLGQSGPALVTSQQGLIEASAWRVRMWRWKDTDAGPPADSASSPLDQLVGHCLRQLGDPVSLPPQPQQLSIDECTRLLGAANLDPDQQLRFALCTPHTADHATLLREQLQRDPHRSVQLLPGWTMPLSLALRTMELTDEFPHAAGHGDELLFPEQLGSLAEQLAFAQKLHGDGRHSEAELLLLNMRPSPDSAQAGERQQQLLQLRSGSLSTGRFSVAPAGPVTVSFETRYSRADGYRLNSMAQAGRRSRLSRFYPTVPSWNRSLFMIDPGPPVRLSRQTPQKVLQSGIPGVTAHVALIDQQQGVKSSFARLDDVRFPGNVSHQDHWECPGLIPVRRGTELGVSSLLSSDPLQPLWLRAVPQHRSGQVIALNSRQFLVCSNAGIQSFHPLTGKRQWSHLWKQSRQLRQLAGQYLKVYTTDAHVILLPSLGTGCVVLRADDGMLLRQGSRPSGDLSHVIDGHLLTLTEDSQLHVVRLADEQHIPVELSGQRVRRFHPAGELGRRQALILTDAPEIIILDVPSGTIDTRLPLPQRTANGSGALVIPKLIRRSGLLYLSIGDRTWRPPYIPEPVFGEVVAGNGMLLCMDPDTGRQLWQQDQHPAVVPPILGDPCPFLVQWSTRYVHDGPRFRIRSVRQRTSLEIRVLDAFTGEVVGESVQQLAARPLRIVHDADRQQLQITTEHSTTTVTYESRP